MRCVTIKYLPQRFSVEKILEEKIPYVRGKTYLYYLRRSKIIPEKFLKSKFTVIESGEIVSNTRIRPRPGTTLVVTPKIKWPVLVWVGHIIWAYALAHPFIFWMTVISLSYSIYSSLTMRNRMPNFGLNGAGLDEGSPTYGWDGIRQTSSVGVPVGILYGEHRVGGNVINEYISTDGDKVFLHTLTCLGEGEIESISAGMIDKNPIENYSNVETVTRLGTNDQTVIPNFEDLHNLRALGIALTKDSAYTITTEDDDIEGFEIYLSLTNGLSSVTSSGEIASWAVSYRVEYKLSTDSSWIDLGVTEINEISRTVVRRMYRKNGLTAGQYDIRITRTSDDTDFEHTGDLTLQYLDEIKTDDIAYVNSVLVATNIQADNQLSNSPPNVTWLVKGRKVSVPDIRTSGGVVVAYDDYYWDPVAERYKLFADGTELIWDGVTFVNAYSANPIWCITDLINATRYGLGRFISQENMDMARLIDMSQTCDERVQDGRGGYEKRYRLDVVIDSRVKALDLITQLTVTCAAFPSYSAGAINLTVDRPIELPSQEFGMGNTIKDTFSESFKSITEVPNVVHVTFNDREKDYEQDNVTVQDVESLERGDPESTVTLRVFCTRVSQAIRAGKYALYVAKYINRSVSFKTGMEAILCQVGDKIDYSHDVPQWGFSGRVKTGSTTSNIILDRSVEVESGKTYELQLRYGADVIEKRVVANAVGTHTNIEVLTPFSGTPEVGAVYAFGEENIVTKPFRVISIERMGSNEAEVQAIEYDERVYVEDPLLQPESNYSALTFDTPDVTDLVLTESLVKLGDGTIEDCIDVWFAKPSVIGGHVLTYQKAKIYLSDNGGKNWMYRGETSSQHFRITGGLIDGTEYTVAVVSIANGNRENAISDSPSQKITLIGKSAAPADITSFLVNQSRDRISLSWTGVTDVDLSGYEIRFGDGWEAGVILATQLKSTNYIALTFPEGVQSYWIKAIDTSGNYSVNAKQATITVDNIPFQNIVDQWSEQVAWSGTKVDCSKVGDNIELDSGKLTGTYETAVRDIGFVANFRLVNENVVIDATSSDAEWDDNATAEMDDSSTLRFTGDEIVGAASTEIRTSDDNITWSDYAPWQAGDYRCRYFQLKTTITRSETTKVIQFTEQNYYADLPDVQENQEATISTAANGVTVTFNKAYHQDPYINVTILSGSGVYHLVTGIDTTGCTIKLYNAAGTAQTGDIRVHVNGV